MQIPEPPLQRLKVEAAAALLLLQLQLQGGQVCSLHQNALLVGAHLGAGRAKRQAEHAIAWQSTGPEACHFELVSHPAHVALVLDMLMSLMNFKQNWHVIWQADLHLEILISMMELQRNLTHVLAS